MAIELDTVYHNSEAGFDVRAVANPDYRGEPGDRFVVHTRPHTDAPWERPADRCSDADSACERVAVFLTWAQSPYSR